MDSFITDLKVEIKKLEKKLNATRIQRRRVETFFTDDYIEEEISKYQQIVLRLEKIHFNGKKKNKYIFFGNSYDDLCEDLYESGFINIRRVEQIIDDYEVRQYGKYGGELNMVNENCDDEIGYLCR